MRTPKIYRRKRDGFWEISYYLGGKRKRQSLGTKCEMTANLLASKLTGYSVENTAKHLSNSQVTSSEKSQDLATFDNISTPSHKTGVLFVEAVNQFIKAKWGINDTWMHKPKPQCNNPPTLYVMILKRFQAFSKVKSIDEVTYDNLQGFVSSQRENMKDRTLNKHISRLRRFLDYCVNMEYIQINHANKLETYKSKPPVRYSFSKDEIKMILEKSNPQFSIFFELMLETGLRACDTWYLTKDNFPGGNFLHIFSKKNGDELYVPISQRAQEIVAGLEHVLFPWADRAWCKKNGELLQQHRICLNDLRKCFGGVRDDGCLDRGYAYCKPHNIREHTFRHTFAMWKLAEGCPLEVLKDLMGHTRLDMTEVYAHSMPKSALAKWV